MASPVLVFAAIASLLALGAGAFNVSKIELLKGEDLMVVTTTTACFADLLYRGFGVRPYLCPEGFEKDGQMCFRRCNFGYSGEGDQCVMNCPPGFSTTGDFCTKMWAKGCCCIGCCNGCPDGSTDIGCFCAQSIHRHFYPRGPSSAMVCAPGQDLYEGLCYPSCPNGYIGMGPMCWGGNHKTHVFQCSPFLYTTEASACEMVEKRLHFIEKGLRNGCLAALLGSTVLPVLTMEGAARICKDNMLQGVTAINMIMQLTNAKICNPIAPTMCLMQTSNIGNIGSITGSIMVTGSSTQTITESISATQSFTESSSFTQSQQVTRDFDRSVSANTILDRDEFDL